MKISVDHTQSSSCLSLSFSIISSYFDIDARLGGPTARSVVISLDYRPGTELASLISSSVLAHSFSLILSSYFLCRFPFLCSLYLPRSSVFRCILFYACEPSSPPFSSLFSSPSFRSLSPRWHNLVASQACKRLLAFSNLATIESWARSTL